MKNYTKPNVEIVAIETADVITASSIAALFTNFRSSGIEHGGSARVTDMSGYAMSSKLN